MTRRTLLSAAAGSMLLSASPANGWKLGVITDECGLNIDEALKRFVPEYGLKYVELREITLANKRMYVYRDASAADLREIRKRLDDAGVKLSVLDSAVYKIALPGTTLAAPKGEDKHPPTGEYERQMDDLKRAAEAAHQLGTDRVRIFTFLRVENPSSVFSRVVDELNRAIQVARQAGIGLVMENEMSCNVGTGAESAQLFKAIPDRTLMHNWDPGNCVPLGEKPYPDGWNQLDHSRIGHMHLKDATGSKWEPIGGGTIDFVGQFRALKEVKYQGTMSLETHYRNPQNNPYTSSEESMNGLLKVIQEASA